MRVVGQRPLIAVRCRFRAFALRNSPFTIHMVRHSHFVIPPPFCILPSAFSWPDQLGASTVASKKTARDDPGPKSVIRHCPAPLDATAANESEICHLQSAIKRSAPATPSVPRSARRSRNRRYPRCPQYEDRRCKSTGGNCYPHLIL